MADPLARLRRFLRELKRRNVYKVAVTYLVSAFVAIQAANLLVPETTLPAGSETFVIYVAIFGFPVALVLAWAFEMTPEGVRRTPEAERERTEPAGSGAGGWIAALVVLLVAGGGFWYLTAGSGEQPAEKTAAATDTAQASGATAASTTTRGRPFVAVLPLENLSPKEENKFFAAGIHEEVLTQLSKVSGLGVYSRTTMTELAEAEMTAAEIGRELEADAILEGSVRRAAGRVRISAQLIDPKTGDHLWSATYERALSPEAIFDIQADIAQQIAGSLETRLAEGERERIAEAPTDDLAAYDAYLRGRNHYFQHWATFRPADIRRSIEAFREAVRRDSTFAEAHAWLGLAYARRSTGGHERWLDSASAAVERARRIEPDLAAAHLAAGWIYRQRDSTAAQISSLRRALELQPSQGYAKSRLSDALQHDGQYVEAIRVAREAVELAPRQPVVLTEMADQLRAVDLYEAAAAWDRHALEIEPGHVEAILGLSVTHLDRGRPEEALATWQPYLERTGAPPLFALGLAARAALQAGQPAEARAYLERIPEARQERRPERTEARSEPKLDDPLSQLLQGRVELRLGNRERGRRLLQQAAGSLPDANVGGGRRRIRLAEARAALGQPDRALEQLERAREAGYFRSGPGSLAYDPVFDSLRSDPRFQEILRAAERNRKRLQQQVRQLGLDLYPPGAEPDTVSREVQSDD